jgi:hypothetical protein
MLDAILAIEGEAARKRMMDALQNVRREYMPGFQGADSPVRKPDEGSR